MSREAIALELPAPTPAHVRACRALSAPAGWLQLARFAVVGLSGYAVNLGVFTALVHGAGLAALPAAAGAFVVAVTNNFAWNRGWTFRARDRRAVPQAVRFLVVSLAGFGVNLGVLAGLVDAGLPSVAAQALAVVTAIPLTFAGNKLWTFAG